MRMAQGEYQNRIHFAWIVWAPATPATDSEMVSSIIVASDMPSSVPPNSCGLANMIVMIGSNARTIGAYMQMPRKPALASSRWRSPAYSDFLSINQSICRGGQDFIEFILTCLSLSNIHQEMTGSSPRCMPFFRVMDVGQEY